MLIQPVMLLGGSGTRLWPLSREKYLKQWLALMREDVLREATLRASVWLNALELCRPDVLAVCESAWKSGSFDPPFTHAAEEEFAGCPSIGWLDDVHGLDSP